MDRYLSYAGKIDVFTHSKKQVSTQCDLILASAKPSKIYIFVFQHKPVLKLSKSHFSNTGNNPIWNFFTFFHAWETVLSRIEGGVILTYHVAWIAGAWKEKWMGNRVRAPAFSRVLPRLSRARTIIYSLLLSSACNALGSLHADKNGHFCFTYSREYVLSCPLFFARLVTRAKHVCERKIAFH